MKILILLLIFYTVSVSEQKPLDKSNSDSTDTGSTVFPLSPDLVNSNHKFLSALKEDDSKFTHQEENVPVTRDSLVANNDETHILKIPLKKSGLISTTLNNAEGEAQKSSSDKSIANNISNKSSNVVTLIPDVKSTPIIEDVAIGDHGSEDLSNAGVKIDHTSIPSLSKSLEVTEPSIPVVIQEDVSQLELDIQVIPLAENKQLTKLEPTSASNNITSPTKHSTHLLGSDNIGYDGESSTPIAVFDDTVETLSPGVSQDILGTPSSLLNKLQQEQQSVATNLDDNKSTEDSRSFLSTNSSELMIAVETLSNKLPELDIGVSPVTQSAILKYTENVKDLNATDATTTAIISNTHKSTDTTEVTLPLNTAQETSNKSTDLNINLESTAPSTLSTSTTESISLIKERIESQLLIQDLLDPAIVLAKRSVPDLHDIKNPSDIEPNKSIHVENQSRSGKSEKTKADGDDIKETSARVRRNAWSDDWYNTHDDSHRVDDSWWHKQETPSYRTHQDYEKRRYDVDDEVRSGSRSPPFKLIPVFSG